MANQGAKKRKEENHRHMKNLLYLIIVCNVIYIIVRMLIFHSTFTWKHWFGLLVTSLAYGLPYQQLAMMARPAYSDDGELLDGGFDMKTGGVCGYLHDVIYITSFVQLMSIFSGKFWYTFSGGREFHFIHKSVDSVFLYSDADTVIFIFSMSQIPAFAIYKLYDSSKGFFSQGSEGYAEDEKSRKKREKMEKKASRPKLVRARAK